MLSTPYYLRTPVTTDTQKKSDLPLLPSSVRWFPFVPQLVLTGRVGQLRHERPYLAATLETQLSEVTVLHA